VSLRPELSFGSAVSGNAASTIGKFSPILSASTSLMRKRTGDHVTRLDVMDVDHVSTLSSRAPAMPKPPRSRAIVAPFRHFFSSLGRASTSLEGETAQGDVSVHGLGQQVAERTKTLLFAPSPSRPQSGTNVF